MTIRCYDLLNTYSLVYSFHRQRREEVIKFEDKLWDRTVPKSHRPGRNVGASIMSTE